MRCISNIEIFFSVALIDFFAGKVEIRNKSQLIEAMSPTSRSCARGLSKAGEKFKISWI